MIQPIFTIRQVSFVHQKVTRTVDSKGKDAVTKSLKAVKKRMLANLRYRRQPSRPGQPPNVQTRNPSRSLRNILIAYDRQSKIGTVGSVNLPIRDPRIVDNAPLPGFLEAGGVRRVKVGKTNRGRRQRIKQVRVAARPNAGPSFQKAISSGEIISPWKNIVAG